MASQTYNWNQRCINTYHFGFEEHPDLDKRLLPSISPLTTVISHNWEIVSQDHCNICQRTGPRGHQIGDAVGPLSSRPVGPQLIPGKRLGNNKQKKEDFISFSSPHPIPLKTRNKFKMRKGMCVRVKVNQHLYVGVLWKCLVKLQMISKYYVSTCIYFGKEAHIHHSVVLKSSIRTSQTVRI